MKNRILAFIADVVLAGVTSWGASKVEQKLEQYLGDKKETTLIDEPEIIISYGLDAIAEKFAEYVRVKDKLAKAESKQKYGQARHLAYHVECARRDLDMLLLDLSVAPDAPITQEFLDEV
jgi:hypothetical protein